MAREHLSTDRLQALHRGEIDDFASLEHLATCQDCRRAFDDTRWILLLRRLPDLIDAGPHPSADVLAAYHTYALSSRRVAEIKRHLRACQTCMARAGQARRQERALHYRSPSPASLKSIQKRFRARPLRRLGTVVVALVGQALRLQFVPEPATAAGIHPTSASGRLRRLFRSERPREERVEEPQLIADWTLDGETAPEMPEPGESNQRAAMRRQSIREELSDSMAAAETAAAGAHLQIPGDGFGLILAPREGRELDVRVVSRTSESAKGIRVRLRGADGPGTEGVTDDEGHTTLRLDPDATEIVVEVEPPVAILLRHL